MRGVTIGVLVIQTVERRTFEPYDIDLFQTCAQLISPIVMNARLLSLVDESDESIQRSAAELASHGIRVAGTARPRAEHNVEFRGIGTSRGIAIGPVYRMENPLDLAVLEYTPRPSAEAEESDLLQAIQLVRRDLDDNREELGDRFGPDFSAVFHTHIQILEDKGFVAKLRKAVNETGNARNALVEVLAAYRKTFGRIQDAYFRDRMMDVEDVGRRVMEQMLGDRHVRPTLERGSIVVSDNLLPGHFARLDLDRVAAIVSEHGGPTSHGAIFARTLEIPAVTGVPGLIASIRPGELAIVDGGEGTVFLSPDDRLVAEYQRARERFEIAAEHLDALRALPAETRDGRRIALTANCGLVSDLRLVEQHGAEGVGLFRTEMLAVAHRGFPEEEEQEQLYERVATLLAPRPVTIRTLDLGGDKEVANLALPHEDNPQLGCRSIRLSFTHLDAFRAQLRAILRASASGNVRLLLPMISSLEELRRAREILEETKEGMRSAGVAFDPELPVGIMIEVPSAALIADALARECRLLQHRDERSHPVHARGRPRQRAHRPSVRSAAPGRARADRPQRARRDARGHSGLGLRRDGEQPARRADPGRARDRRAVRDAERRADREGDRARARSARRRGRRAARARSRHRERGARDRRRAPAARGAARPPGHRIVAARDRRAGAPARAGAQRSILREPVRFAVPRRSAHAPTLCRSDKARVEPGHAHAFSRTPRSARRRARWRRRRARAADSGARAATARRAPPRTTRSTGAPRPRSSRLPSRTRAGSAHSRRTRSPRRRSRARAARARPRAARRGLATRKKSGVNASAWLTCSSRE